MRSEPVNHGSDPASTASPPAASPAPSEHPTQSRLASPAVDLPSPPAVRDADHAPELEPIPENPADSRSLATSLVPVLRRDTELRLGEINWFRADWQRGGAATGRSTWALDGDRTVEVIVKLPVPQRELIWTRRLQPDPDRPAEENFPPVVPLLFAGGSAINGYDIAWIVMEALPHGPLGMQWRDTNVARLAETLARFHRVAARYPVDRPPRTEDWESQVRRAEREIARQELPEATRWKRLLRRTARHLDGFVDRWRQRPIDGWIHGDAHLANAMMREDDPEAAVCLIDLAEVRPGHWIEDAILLERLMWARPERLAAAPPVETIAAARRRHGLPVGDDHEELAELRRLLLAATALCFLRTEGHPRHLEACLNHGERALERLR
jgi:hypothetical protein